MKQLLTITLLLVVLSCGQNKSSKSDLLTSSIWTIEKESIDDFPRMTDKYEFLTDGTCLIVNGESEIHGNWSWAKDDEIYIKLVGAVVNGQKVKIDEHGVCIKILELNKKGISYFRKVRS